MTKYFIPLVFLFTFTSSLLAQPTVKVGIICPLSGNSAQLGEGFRDAMLLAQEKLSNKEVKLELVFEDDQNDPKQTVTALRKISEQDKCDVVISYFGGPGLVVMPVANQRKFVHIGNGIDRRLAQGDYSFVYWDDVEDCVPLFIQELEKRNIKTISIVNAKQHAGTYVNSFLEPALQKSKVKLISKYEFSPGERDFRTVLNKLQADKPDIIFFFAFSPEIELFCKQKSEMNFKTPLTGINGFDWAESLKPFEGYWYVSYSYTDQFYNNFVAKYKRDPYTSSANGYDIINLISTVSSELVKENKPITRENLQKALSVKNDFVGVLGPMTVDKDGFFKTEARVKEVKNGKGVTLK